MGRGLCLIFLGLFLSVCLVVCGVCAVKSLVVPGVVEAGLGDLYPIIIIQTWLSVERSTRKHV